MVNRDWVVSYHAAWWTWRSDPLSITFMSSRNNTLGGVLIAIIVTVVGGVITAAIVYHLHLGGSQGPVNTRSPNDVAQTLAPSSPSAGAPQANKSAPTPAISAYSIAGSWVTPNGAGYRFVKSSNGNYKGIIFGTSGCGSVNLNIISAGGGYYTGSSYTYIKWLFLCIKHSQYTFTIQISANGKTAQFNVTAGCLGSCKPETWVRAQAS
jgi:hypothetical protein